MSDEKILTEDVASFDLIDLEEMTDEGCPICGGDNIIHEGRCFTCADCGWSKCEI
jgi:hypothetical protein